MTMTKKEKAHKKLDQIKTFGGVGFLLIPAGLIYWLFLPDGWKISVIGVIVFLTGVILSFGLEQAIQKMSDDE